MGIKTKTKTVPEVNLPEVKLASAEKVLRDIAKRNGEVIRKRRSVTLKENLGDGYAVIDPDRNMLLSGGNTSDGCDLSLADLADRYRKDGKKTPWQGLVIKAIQAGKISE